MPPAADAPAAACPSKQRSRELSERRSASRRAERLSCPAEPMVEEAPEPAPSELADATQAAGIILVREPQRQQGAERGAECIPSEMAEMAELEVLIGRYEVINALKSKRNEPVAQRYPGEWHFPGGTKRQADRGPLQTACRELCEEFLVGLNAFGSFGGDWSSGGVGAGSGPAQLKAVLFSTVSLELQSQRYEQYVFVADVADNHLPLEFTTEGVNHALRRRRQHYERLQASEAWWEMAASAKAAIAPEVREVRWLPLTEALAVMDPALPFIDEWQASLTQVSHKSRTRLTQVSHKSLTSLSQASHKPLASLSHTSPHRSPHTRLHTRLHTHVSTHTRLSHPVSLPTHVALLPHVLCPCCESVSDLSLSTLFVFSSPDSCLYLNPRSHTSNPRIPRDAPSRYHTESVRRFPTGFSDDLS